MIRRQSWWCLCWIGCTSCGSWRAARRQGQTWGTARRRAPNPPRWWPAASSSSPVSPCSPPSLLVGSSKPTVTQAVSRLRPFPPEIRQCNDHRGCKKMGARWIELQSHYTRKRWIQYRALQVALFLVRDFLFHQVQNYWQITTGEL